MSDEQSLAEQFEADRGHLRAVAYRLLGSMHDADDAVQAAWLKVCRAGSADLRNPTGWFTTDFTLAERRVGSWLFAPWLLRQPYWIGVAVVALVTVVVGVAVNMLIERMLPGQAGSLPRQLVFGLAMAMALISYFVFFRGSSFLGGGSVPQSDMVAGWKPHRLRKQPLWSLSTIDDRNFRQANEKVDP